MRTSYTKPGGELSGPIDLRWSDAAFAALLAGGTVVYLATFPLSVIGPTDEAHALHQAKRLLNGEVLYRDLFDLTTPLWTYLMACLFWLFGTTLATARTAVAVIHGVTVLGLFLVCRRLGVRRELAAVAALGQLVVCQPVYPVANRHWLVTSLCVLLLLWCVQARRRAAWSIGTGVIVGLLIATHQQRGVSMGLGVFASMLAEPLLDWRYRNSQPAAGLILRLAAFAGGILLVVGPTLSAVVIRAGFEPVWYALIVHPLTHYRGTLYSPWGYGGRGQLSTLVLKYVHLVLVLSTARLLWLLRHRSDPDRARLLLLLTSLCLSAILSIAYYPDRAHLAFIAPLFFVAIAEALEWLLRLLPRRLSVSIAHIMAALILVASGLQLQRTWTREHHRYPVTRSTAFGRIDFLPGFAATYDQLDRLLGEAPSRTLYAHPISSHVYLLLGARNPTRFEFMHVGSYNTDEQVREVRDALAANDVPYVFFPFPHLLRPDPLVQFIRQHYAPLTEPGRASEAIWKRKPRLAEDPTGPPAPRLPGTSSGTRNRRRALPLSAVDPAHTRPPLS